MFNFWPIVGPKIDNFVCIYTMRSQTTNNVVIICNQGPTDSITDSNLHE